MGKEKAIRILGPVDKLREAETLINGGATELYGGMFPSYFAKYPVFLSPNQRTFKEAQMDEGEFAGVVELGKKTKTPVYLAINQLYFIEEQIPLIVRMARDAERMGVGGIIMGSGPLMLHIQKAGIKVPIHLSTMGVVLNHLSAKFFYELGIKRITLPRSLLIGEIKDIVRNNREIEFDSFILVGKCPNVEGFCTFLHTNPDKIWPCEQEYEIKIRSIAHRAERKAANVQKQWQGFPRSHGCGICAVSELLKAGVTGLKIVGRGSSTSFKLKNIKLLKDAVNIISKSRNKDKKTVCEKLKTLYAETFSHPCTPFTCYFPEGKF